MGIPIAKGRPRFVVRGGFARAYTPAKTRNYADLIASEAMVVMAGRKPLEGALKVSVVAFFPVTKSTNKTNRALMLSGQMHHIKKPDCDNIGKQIDALNGIAWLDDSQIVDMRIEKVYSEEPRLLITIENYELKKD